MRKTIAAIIISLSIAGCASFPDGRPLPVPIQIPGVQTDAIATANAVIAKAAEVCGWEPTFETASSLLGSFTGGGSIATIVNTIARAACNVITRPGARRGLSRGVPPRLYGVSLQGRFLPRR